jgi:hypothetical protein
VSSQSWFGVGGIEPPPPNAAKENHTKGNVILKRGEFRCSLAKAPLAGAMSIGMKMLMDPITWAMLLLYLATLGPRCYSLVVRPSLSAGDRSRSPRWQGYPRAAWRDRIRQ